MEVTHMEIEKKLKEARTNVGLTQEQVAEKIMVSRQTISNWENGKSLPDIVSILNLSDLYQISLDELGNCETSYARSAILIENKKRIRLAHESLDEKVNQLILGAL